MLKYPDGTAYSKLPNPFASLFPDEIVNGGLPKLIGVHQRRFLLIQYKKYMFLYHLIL